MFTAIFASLWHCPGTQALFLWTDKSSGRGNYMHPECEMFHFWSALKWLFLHKLTVHNVWDISLSRLACLNYACKVVIQIKTMRGKCFLILTRFVSVLWVYGPWNNQICFDTRTGFLSFCYPSHRVPIESSPTVPAWSIWFWRFVEMLVILSGISTTET